jgi:hypothetical protein
MNFSDGLACDVQPSAILSMSIFQIQANGRFPCRPQLMDMADNPEGLPLEKEQALLVVCSTQVLSTASPSVCRNSGSQSKHAVVDARLLLLGKSRRCEFM